MAIREHFPAMCGSMTLHRLAMAKSYMEMFCGRKRNIPKTCTRAVADIEQGHISTASCIIANLAMQLQRPPSYDPIQRIITDDEEATKLLQRQYRSPWQHPFTANV